jgi:hypothetical protein
MSKISIEGNALGSGTLTIAAPNTNTNYTLTLPTETGTIVTTGITTGLSASALSTGTLAAARLPAGSVLQVVQSDSLSDTTIASTSFQDTTLTASITPSSATSKILVFVTQAYLVYRQADTVVGGLRILRGATAIATHDITPTITGGLNSSSELATRGVWSMCYLDSPATTSSTTYKTQGKVSSTANSGQMRLQQNGTEISTITLMEIAA